MPPVGMMAKRFLPAAAVPNRRAVNRRGCDHCVDRALAVGLQCSGAEYQRPRHPEDFDPSSAGMVQRDSGVFKLPLHLDGVVTIDIQATFSSSLDFRAEFSLTN